MDPDFIRRLCEIFGVSAEDVIDGGGEVDLPRICGERFQVYAACLSN